MQPLLISQGLDVADRHRAVGDRDRHIDQHPARVVPGAAFPQPISGFAQQRGEAIRSASSANSTVPACDTTPVPSVVMTGTVLPVVRCTCEVPLGVGDLGLSARPQSQQRQALSRFQPRVGAPKSAGYCNDGASSAHKGLRHNEKLAGTANKQQVGAAKGEDSEVKRDSQANGESSWGRPRRRRPSRVVRQGSLASLRLRPAARGSAAPCSSRACPPYGHGSGTWTVKQAPPSGQEPSDQAQQESGRRESNSRSQLGKLMFCR